MNLVDTLFGRPLATEEEKAERIGPLKGIPIFGLDALSSAAYGPEAALTLLIPLGMAGAIYVWPITIGIVVLLGIVYFSYRQTIAAYPQGGGSYTVATENLGEGAGLLSAAALMIDYVLTAAVGISAGVGALVSAVPSLQRRYALHMPGDSDRHHAHQFARSAGKWRRIPVADVRFHRLPSGVNRGWYLQDIGCGRASGPRGCPSEVGRSHRDRERMAPAAHLLERLHRDDWSRGRQQRGHGLS